MCREGVMKLPAGLLPTPSGAHGWMSFSSLVTPLKDSSVPHTWQYL